MKHHFIKHFVFLYNYLLICCIIMFMQTSVGLVSHTAVPFVGLYASFAILFVCNPLALLTQSICFYAELQKEQ